MVLFAWYFDVFFCSVRFTLGFHVSDWRPGTRLYFFGVHDFNVSDVHG